MSGGSATLSHQHEAGCRCQRLTALSRARPLRLPSSPTCFVSANSPPTHCRFLLTAGQSLQPTSHTQRTHTYPLCLGQFRSLDATAAAIACRCTPSSDCWLRARASRVALDQSLSPRRAMSLSKLNTLWDDYLEQLEKNPLVTKVSSLAAAAVACSTLAMQTLALQPPPLIQRPTDIHSRCAAVRSCRL